VEIQPQWVVTPGKQKKKTNSDNMEIKREWVERWGGAFSGYNDLFLSYLTTLSPGDIYRRMAG
jgi:hypothetical protein